MYILHKDPTLHIPQTLERVRASFFKPQLGLCFRRPRAGRIE